MPPTTAQAASQPDAFASYAHADEALVHAEIRHLQDAGVRVWYDSAGIGAGTEWSDEIAHAIKAAPYFVYFVTPRSVASEHCRRELNFAQTEGRTVIVVHLEPTDMPDGLRLSLDSG